MEMSGGRRGFVVSRRPRSYKATPQQKRFKEALEFCGIVKGISRAELREKMINCIPEYFKKGKSDG